VQAQLKGVMKSTSEMLMDAKSVIRKIEFLGHRKLPYRMKHQEIYHYEGSYHHSYP
jgi:ribosomal protein S6